MAFFKPGMFAKRGVASAPKEQEPPAPPPAQCDVCGLEGHDRATCWSIIRTRADVERTWGRSGSAEQSNGEGEMFEAMRDLWRRMKETR